MALSAYHQKQLQLTEEEIQSEVFARKEELKQIFEQVAAPASAASLRVAVLGCGEKRLVSANKKIFEEVLGRPVMANTFDITIDHLKGESDIFEYDCIQPLPGGPYNIAYSHLLLRFVQTENQWYVLENSFSALAEGGLAIHILGGEDLKQAEAGQRAGFYQVPLEDWKKKFYMQGIQFMEIPLSLSPKSGQDSLALVLMR